VGLIAIIAAEKSAFKVHQSSRKEEIVPKELEPRVSAPPNCLIQNWQHSDTHCGWNPSGGLKNDQADNGPDRPG
jgi:hypothetical protein